MVGAIKKILCGVGTVTMDKYDKQTLWKLILEIVNFTLFFFWKTYNKCFLPAFLQAIKFTWLNAGYQKLKVTVLPRPIQESICL